MRETISCRYCIAFEVMLLVSSFIYNVANRKGRGGWVRAVTSRIT